MVQNCWDVDPTQTQYCEFFSQDLAGTGVSTYNEKNYTVPGSRCQPPGSSCCLLMVRSRPERMLMSPSTMNLPI